ncbi:Neoverrucotoxin subunit alpha [Triplophysa tibetana]|uniref:Neoverrucotoxin subunit alpha n=1 Tax=Triplophysa tibetana TaxID=1572043 RepID=A0A5A9NQV3_9TELE|nr:Neoverrucotoxin subunit alpha [Triplophysa tibetana]
MSLWSSMIRLPHENIRHFLASSLLKIDTEEGKSVLYTTKKNPRKGLRLWTKEQLEQNICANPQIYTDFQVTTSDSLEEKLKILKIDGSLKLSLLGGLVSLSGAANYLKDTKKSFNQQRLTLHYHCTTQFKEMTINHLTSGDVLHYDDDGATHVVTAVVYGADACFVFDREVSSDEDKKTVEIDVQVALKKLKSIASGKTGAKFDKNANQKTALQKFSCTFYGDFQLSSNPTTFDEAVKVFESLPNLLGENNERVVPLRVWLYPLDKLFSRVVKFQHDISISLITDIESMIESLNTTDMKCSDLLTDKPALEFKGFQDKIQRMKQNCHNHKLSLMKDLGLLLPKIRGKFIKDTELIDLLREHEESPFHRSALEQWLKEKEEESDVIKILLSKLNDSGATVEVKPNNIMMDLEAGHLVSYTFTSLGWSDELLSEQKAYRRPETKGKNDENVTDAKNKPWLTQDVQKIMKNNLKIFKDLIDSNDCKSTKFIVMSKEMEEHPGSCILLIEDGCDDAVCFSPPSKPDCPIVEEIIGPQVVLRVSASCPSTVEKKLLYKMKKEKDWTSQPVLKNQRTVTLTDLNSDTEYDIKCAAVGNLNYTIESDVVTVTTKRASMAILGHELFKIDQQTSKSILIEDGNPARYHLQTTTDNLDESKSYGKKIFGKRDPKKSHKTVLLLGETGTGKTTLINTMINYMCGVKREHKIWFEITDDQSKETSAHSQTSVITVYGVYIPEILVDFTIIETPGYGDTRGYSLHESIPEGLLNVCSSEGGVHEIDAVCFVIKANQNRLNDTQQYIFDAVQSLFAKDIEENIVLLFTHSDGAPPKNTLKAVKDAKFKCAVDEEKQPIYFLFNNCQSETMDEEYQTIQKQTWDLSYKGITGLFKFLDTIRPKSLWMTQHVLQKRKRLDADIVRLRSQNLGRLVFDAFYCVEVLGIIALNIDSPVMLRHIDFLIDMLKEIKEPEKAETLENIKKRAGK